MPQPAPAADSIETAMQWLYDMMEQADSEEPSPPAEAAQQEPGRKPAVKPFNLEGVHQSVVEAYNSVIAWLRAIKNGGIPPYSLTLCGHTGCGKTHLLQNAAAYLNRQTYTCASYTWPELLQLFKQDELHTLETLKKHKALAVDDIGAENTSGKYTRGISADLLGRLTELRLGKWTLYATGYNLKGIENIYDPRVASRLIRNGGRTVDMTAAADYSLTHQEERRAR